MIAATMPKDHFIKPVIGRKGRPFSSAMSASKRGAKKQAKPKSTTTHQKTISAHICV